MKRMFLASALVLAAGIAVAQPGPDFRGPGMMGGFGPGYGAGPGMMGGWGHGYGMGPGMMGGYGAGPALWMLDLSAEQRAELAKIQDEARSRQWEIAGRMHDEMAKYPESMGAQGRRDRADVLAAYDRMAALRRQRVEIALDTAERTDKVLTPEQREQLRRWTPWWVSGRGGAR